MGIFSFLRRKKKEEGFGEASTQEFPEEHDLGGSFEQSQDIGFKPRFNEPVSPYPSQQFSQPSGLSATDAQLIMAKLDVMNHRLELMDRRLQVIEDIAKQSR